MVVPKTLWQLKPCAGLKQWYQHAVCSQFEKPE